MTKQSTKTVSSCCKAPIITMQASEGTGYYVCSKCHIGCDSTPIPSPTETVSEDSLFSKKVLDRQHEFGLWVTGKTPPTEPTVKEKKNKPILNNEDFYWEIGDDGEEDGFLHIVCTIDGSEIKIPIKEVVWGKH